MRFVAAGLLGLLVPGAGHALLGRRRAALLFALPFLVLIGAGLALYATGGDSGLLAFVVTPGVLPGLALLNIALAAWRLAAAFDASRGGPRPAATLGIVGAGALALVLVPHAWAGITISATNDLIDSVFAPEETPVASAEPSPRPTAVPPGADFFDPVAHDPFAHWTPLPTPSPTPTPKPRGPLTAGTGTLPGLGVAVPWQRPGAIPWGSDGKFDLLLMGSDAGADRWSRRVDAMLLVEVDVATGRVSFVGVPRNLLYAPFPPGPARDAVKCGCLTDLLNSAYVEATLRHPNRWPGTGAVKGIGAVRAMVSQLTGRPIDAVVIVDMWGMIKAVDALGGIDINVPYAVRDPRYADPVKGLIKLYIPAGKQHLNGRLSLAYARSRHQDSDYGRMARQQILLVALRAQINAGTILGAPALFDAAKGFAWTDLPRSSLPNLVDLFSRAKTASVKRMRIIPPTYSSVLTSAEIKQIRKDVAAFLGVPLSSPTPSPTPSPGPSPSPSPSPSQSSTTSPAPTAQPPPSP